MENVFSLSLKVWYITGKIKENVSFCCFIVNRFLYLLIFIVNREMLEFRFVGKEG